MQRSTPTQQRWLWINMLVVAGRRDRTESLPGGKTRHEVQWAVPKIEGLPSTSSPRSIPLGREEPGFGAGPMWLGSRPELLQPLTLSELDQVAVGPQSLCGESWAPAIYLNIDLKRRLIRSNYQKHRFLGSSLDFLNQSFPQRGLVICVFEKWPWIIIIIFFYQQAVWETQNVIWLFLGIFREWREIGPHGGRKETDENGNIHAHMECFLNSYYVPGTELGAGI